MKIGILGGTGFLGQYVVSLLLEKGDKPIIISRNANTNTDIRVESIKTNYSEEDMLNKFINLDAIIYLAAKRSANSKIEEFHENEILTQNLYNVCSKLNIKNIVYASTISVYSNQKQLPWNEKSCIKPELMYGVSKFSCELIGEIYKEKYHLNIKNLRLAHLFGFYEKNNYMINKFMRQAFNKQTLFLDVKGISKREFLYVKDAAKAIVLAIKSKDEKGTFNIGSGQSFTNYEVAYNINKKFGNKNNLVIKSNSIIDNIKSSYMDSSKAKKELGFSCDYSFEKALEEIYELMKELNDVPILY